MTEMKFCPTCGSPISEDNQGLCKNCGLVFEREEQPRMETAPETSHQSPQPTQPVTYASLFKRVVAFIIDSIIISIASSFFVSIINVPVIIGNPILFYMGNYYRWITTLFNWLIGFFYFWILETNNNGQSLGKEVMHIRTVREDTFDIAEPNQYALTNIFKSTPLVVVDFIIGLLVREKDSIKTYRYLQKKSGTVVIETSD